MAEGHGVFVDGLSFWSGVFPSEFGWERVAVPFSSARKGRNRVIYILASVFEIGLLGCGVDFLSGVKVGRDREITINWS